MSVQSDSSDEHHGSEDSTWYCFVCGGELESAKRGASHDWTSEYRTVYVQYDKYEDVGISRIATLRKCSNRQRIPVDSEGFAKGQGHPVKETFSGFSTDASDWGDGRDLPRAKFWGFPCHANCWEILKAVDDTVIEPLLRPLFEVFISFDVWYEYDGYRNMYALDLGHNYGGLFGDQMHKHPPDEERHPGCHPRVPSEWLWPLCNEKSPFAGYYTPSFQDPYRVCDLEEKIDAMFSAPPEQVDPESSFQKYTTPDRDPFSVLPTEILQLVFESLPSSSVLAFKLASCAAASSPLYGSFWASRFNRGFEYEWIFEVRNTPSTSSARNWKALYFGIPGIVEKMPEYFESSGPWSLGTNLLNRARVFSLAKNLRQLLSLATDSHCSGSVVRAFLDRDVPTMSEFTAPPTLGSAPSAHEWATAALCRLDHFEPENLEHLSALRGRAIVLPDVVTSVNVSFVHIGGIRYVSGISFYDQDGSSTELGYVKNRDSHTWTNDSLGFEGFAVAMDKFGLRAVGLVGAGPEPTWFGHHHRVAKQWATSRSGPVALVGAYFDAFRMVSLSIGTRQEEHEAAPSVGTDEDERKTGPVSHYWEPDLLPRGLSFSALPEQPAYSVRSAVRSRYVLFGGRHGEDLPHLVGITLFRERRHHNRRFGDYNPWKHTDTLAGIEFTYDTEVDGTATRMLGSRGPSDGDIQKDKDEDPEQWRPSEHLAIDGPGGERVVEVRMHNPYDFELQLMTNRGQRLCSSSTLICGDSCPDSHRWPMPGPTTHADVSRSLLIGVYATVQKTNDDTIVLDNFGTVFLEEHELSPGSQAAS